MKILEEILEKWGAKRFNSSWKRLVGASLTKAEMFDLIRLGQIAERERWLKELEGFYCEDHVFCPENEKLNNILGYMQAVDWKERGVDLETM